MFSRLTLHSGKISFFYPSAYKGRILSTQSSLLKEGPERDLINFPRPKRLIDPGKVRYGIIPEEWFEFFYKKTGVTGPYVFGIGFLTYILSKEIWVLEHEYYNGLSLAAIFIYSAKKFGPKIAEFADKQVKEVEDYYNNVKSNALNSAKQGIEVEEKNQWSIQGKKYLFDAKRENVLLQLEAVYRERLYSIYKETKKRLDYHVDMQNTQRQAEQNHMVNWIVSNVIKSISPAQEKESISKCISDLKLLARQ